MNSNNVTIAVSTITGPSDHTRSQAAMKANMAAMPTIPSRKRLGSQTARSMAPSLQPRNEMRVRHPDFAFARIAPVVPRQHDSFSHDPEENGGIAFTLAVLG